MDHPPREWLNAWHVNPSLNRDYDLIDGLRGIAILMVAGGHLAHVKAGGHPALEFLGHLLSGGGFGVVLFFALSGFLISWPFWKRKIQGAAQLTPRGYGWRRFWKIYPPLVLSILILTPLYILDSGDWSFVRTAGQWLTGVALVVPPSGKLNPVMWSLIVESHFYLVLPLLFLCFRKAPVRISVWAIPLLLLLVPVGWRWMNAVRGIVFSLHPEINVHFPSLLDCFALGVLVAGLENIGLIRKSWAMLGNAGCLVLLVGMLAVPCLAMFVGVDADRRFEIVGWFVKIAAGLLLFYIANPQHPVSRWLAQPWLRWFGIISYEWYLFHQASIFLAREWFGPAEGNFIKYWCIGLGALAVSLLLAALVYRYFSLPILKYGRSRNVPERAPAASAPSAAPYSTRA